MTSAPPPLTATTSNGKPVSPFSTLEHYQKIVHELLIQLTKPTATAQEVSNVESNIRILTNHIEQILEKRLDVIPHPDLSDDDFEDEWIILAWGLLTSQSRLPPDINQEIVQVFNHSLVRLVNIARPMRVPSVCEEAKQWWNQFHELYNSSLHYLHGLYSQLDNPNCNIEVKMNAFFNRQLRPCLESFRRMCAANTPGFHSKLRRTQVERLSMQQKMRSEDHFQIRRYYASLAYTLGLLAVRIQGFRYECQISAQNTYATPETLWRLLEEVFVTYEGVLNDALMCNEPNNSPIMVTNNLFTFTCHTLCRTLLFRSFDIQIVSEETATAIQSEIGQCTSGASSPREPKIFPSAALIAMKPTTGVKRNNATANQKGTGGNTAHKKSDVNSQEFVTIPPTFSENANAWQTTYPHLLCTTRQKDAVLLDSKTTTTGKRPLFYFYIRAKTYSPTGEFIYVRTLSLPFTISTRRNQDCQVQRMNSSYTATCFWLYGTCTINGLLLNWNENALTWSQFKNLTRRYFMVNGELNRGMEELDYELLEQKMRCEQCVEERSPGEEGDEEMPDDSVSFKNILCSHLRFDTDTVQMRFSIWRGILEVVQIFQDPKANVKVLWENYLMHGFLDTQSVVELLSGRSNCMVVRLTFVLGGSVCVSYRNHCGEIVHLEPLDLKKLQTKSVLEYIADIAETAKIDYLLTYSNDYMPVSSIIEQHFPMDDVKRVRGVASNITDKGPLNHVTHVKFTPLRVAVVACREQTPRPSPRPPEHPMHHHQNSIDSSPEDIQHFAMPNMPNPRRFLNNLRATPTTMTEECQNMDPMTSTTSSGDGGGNGGGGTFEMQLEELMRKFGKSPHEVADLLYRPMYPSLPHHHHLSNPYHHHPPPSHHQAPPTSSSTLMQSPTLSLAPTPNFDDILDDLTADSADFLMDFPHSNHFLRV